MLSSPPFFRGALLWLLLLPAAGMSADAGRARPREISVAWPKEQPHAKAGKMAVYSGDVDEVGVMFKIPAGTVFSRCGVVLQAEAASPTVTLRLKNEFSTDWDRTATTDAKGYALLRYRTEGAAWLWIKSNGGRARYQVGFFQGNEIPVHRKMETPFLSKAEFDARKAAKSGPAPAAAPAPKTGSAGGTTPVLWVIVGLLGVIAVGVGVLIFRKKP